MVDGKSSCLFLEWEGSRLEKLASDEQQRSIMHWLIDVKSIDYRQDRRRKFLAHERLC